MTINTTARQGDLLTHVLQRLTVTYTGTATATSGTPIDYTGAPVVDPTVPTLGILEQDTDPGQPTAVITHGLCQIISGAAIAKGAAISFDATSRGISSATGNRIFGRAMSTATAAGQKMQLLITREGAA